MTIILLGLAATATFRYFIQKEPKAVFCTQDQRNAAACIQLYDPVCAKVNIQCITTPCDPINQTFSNSCFACMNSLVESYIKGECK